MRRWMQKWTMGIVALRQARQVWRRIPLPLGHKLLVVAVGAVGVIWLMRATKSGAAASRHASYRAGPRQAVGDGDILPPDNRPLKDIN